MAQKMMNSDTGGMHLPRASEHLETAWHWLCERRQHAPAQADVWHLCHHWAVQQQRLLATLLAGEYRLSPMLIVGQKGEQKALWSAQDALVLKWVAPQLPLHARCEHIKGHEGGPASVRKMSAALKQAGYRWVLRTDVKGYYASIDKAQLLGQVCRHITHPVLLGLITQYVHYTVEDGGTFHTPEKGISRSCPLMGTLYLHEMDAHFGQEAEKGTMYYARYMDDIVVLTHSRWQLRKHVRILNRFMTEKTLCQHPDKTFIGRTVKGFDWMGAWLEPQGVTDIAPRAKANHREKVRRLYEQAWRWREPKVVTQRKVSNYRWRWAIWAGALCGLHLQSQAAELVATVPAHKSGIIGYTNYVTSNLYAPNYGGPAGYPNEDYAPALSITTKADGQCNSSIDWREGSTGVLGIPLLGPTSGAVLLPNGTGTWRRMKSNNGSPINGTLTYTNGTWTQSWTGGDRGTNSSNPDGRTQSSYWSYPGCPAIQTGSPWEYASSRSSSYNLQFAIDAPAGGLSPGVYTVATSIIHGDVSYVGSATVSEPLSTSTQITVPDTSCSLDADKTSIPLTPELSTAILELTTTCTEGGVPVPVPFKAHLTANAVQMSLGASADSWMLGTTAGTSGFGVLANWTTAPPSCSAPPTGESVFFDGREGPGVGTTQQSSSVNHMAFRLCGPLPPPGAYTAQMEVRVVQQ